MLDLHYYSYRQGLYPIVKGKEFVCDTIQALRSTIYLLFLACVLLANLIKIELVLLVSVNKGISVPAGK